LALEPPGPAQPKMGAFLISWQRKSASTVRSRLEENSSDPAEEVYARWLYGRPVSKPGDLWALGQHRLLCGDARDPATHQNLMGEQHAAMAFLDPPYNVRTRDIVGRGRVQHKEFAMASGEMSRDEFVGFLPTSLTAAASLSRAGAVHYVCMDWRHVGELLTAGEATYGETLNLAVWVKSNAGQGSFYRSQHELVGIFRGTTKSTGSLVRSPILPSSSSCSTPSQSPSWPSPSSSRFRFVYSVLRNRTTYLRHFPAAGTDRML
jgi:hypothetical protein